MGQDRLKSYIHESTLALDRGRILLLTMRLYEGMAIEDSIYEKLTVQIRVQKLCTRR